MSAIVGREVELQLVRDFLADAGWKPCGLHLHGETGIGKSTVWQAALSEAESLGYRVVSTRPTEAEAQLPFAGLNDLFGDLLDDVQPDLPAPQRLALEIALLRAAPGDHRPEPLAISLAVLGLLRSAAAARPLIVAVDDAPWLDSSSASILEFVLRRLDEEPIGLVIAHRTSGELVGRAPLVSALPDDRIRVARVAPLPMRDIEKLISAALGANLPPSTVSGVHRASGGNPFYAIEIARALQRRGLTRLEGQLRLPDTLAALVRDRLEALSEAAEVVVAHASALSQPTVEVIDAAVASGVSGTGLADAVAAAVVTVDGNLIRFAHPLLAGEAYARLREGERREVHRRLASAVSEPEEHARHLALASAGPDEFVARELDRAAEHAQARGAVESVAELAELAVALTPQDEATRLQRRTRAGHHWMVAGDMGRARAELESTLSDSPPGNIRAEVLFRLGEVLQLIGDWPAAERCFAEALDQVQDDIRLTIEVKLMLAGVNYITGSNLEVGAQHAADAMRLAEELGEPSVLAGTIGRHASWQYDMGHGYSPDLERRVAELEPWTGHLRAVDHPLYDLSFIWRWEGDWQRHREAQERLLLRAERNGDYSSIPNLQKDAMEAEFITGHLHAVAERLDRAERLARATGQRSALTGVLHERAILDGIAGRADEAWEVARLVGRLYVETGMLRYEASFREGLALLELSRRDPAAAHDVLRGSVPWASGAEQPLTPVVTPIHAEALIGLGRLDEARALLDCYERNPQLLWSPLSSVYPGADAARARALLCAAEGDLDEATRFVSVALDAFVAVGDRWQQARTQLINGDIHRRARRRAKAREALTEAETIFNDLGGVLWSAQAREQLQRIGAGREEVRGLTPTQAHVAQLAIGGLTNRQIADRAFMSVHTVEAHLSAVYRTLGISSRRELPAAMRDPTALVRDSATRADPET